MRKKLLSMLLATTMVVGVLTGCGSSTTSAPAETKTEDAAPAEEAASADGSVQVGIVLPTRMNQDGYRTRHSSKRFSAMLVSQIRYYSARVPQQQRKQMLKHWFLRVSTY